MQQWTDDISFYKKVFSNKFIDRLSKAFIGAAHETTHIALQPNAQWDENAKAPWLDKSIVSCSNELSVQNDVAANLNDTDSIVKNKLPFDLLSIELRDGIQNLSKITGQELTEELLDNIFSKFCIGK